ncbi:MAG: hypothetical protein QOJ66_284, partial [Ilumatobacteraceae bacterium]
QRPQAGFGQVGGTNEAVVTGTDHHSVVVGSGHVVILAQRRWG